MPQVFVAIGSNVEPQWRLSQAARALREHFEAVRFSPVYRNAAVGFDGPDFLNAVAGFVTIASIAQLLESLRAIERACGRGPHDPKWAPRAMDLDLLLYGDVVVEGEGYVLPRRDLTRRAYMLGPLAQLAPQWPYPPTGPSIAELWARFPQQAHVLQPIALDLNAL